MLGLPGLPPFFPRCRYSLPGKENRSIWFYFSCTSRDIWQISTCSWFHRTLFVQAQRKICLPPTSNTTGNPFTGGEVLAFFPHAQVGNLLICQRNTCILAPHSQEEGPYFFQDVNFPIYVSKEEELGVIAPFTSLPQKDVPVDKALMPFSDNKVIVKSDKTRL